MHLSYAQTRQRVRAVDLGVGMVVFGIHNRLWYLYNVSKAKRWVTVKCVLMLEC